MADTRSWTWRAFAPMQFVYLLVSFLAVSNTAALEPEGGTSYNHTDDEPQRRTFSTSHAHKSLEVFTAHLPSRSAWSTRSRQLRSQAPAASGDHARQLAWRSIFKNVSDYYDRGIVLVVGADATAEFTSIQDAIDQVPEFNTKRVTIYVKSGIYEEKVIIPASKPYVTLQGEGRNRTIISWHDTAAAAGTLMSASVIVESDHFIARDISFKNTAHAPVPNITNMQAAAIRISGDKAFLLRCNFYSHQDTLYDHQGRHYYFRCFIQGSEDFVFGAARSLFQRCVLHSIAHGDGGALVAQGKNFPGSIRMPSGFSFLQCHIKGTGMPYLGRAWGQYSTVVYSRCQIDANIRPVGWYDWGLREREWTAYLGQFKCTGRGANSTGRVSWSRELTPEEARPFQSVQFVDGPW
ncbi:hypothetical protein KC19_4G265100 [Ceratodon purpureus]|uniref:pectinesterase n=1 Tax=Ceratodon purpureus TaxID=3225 RepID=A0A8T0IFJ5_CERPU|nr:hypothetical protein KC19_4G264900 [Ceratodon purpureus]KAG0581607.1 hypothetical protein KC19_4G265100 [Ceratodon purpureus]